MKRSRKIKLALMGITPLMLAGCDSSSNKTTLVYKDVESCVKDGVLDQNSCQYYYNRSWKNHLSEAPRYSSEASCEQDFSTECQQISSGEYIPTLEGFMVTQAGRNSSSFTVIPLYLGSGGYWRSPGYDRIGSGYKQGKTSYEQKKSVKPTLKSTTMKRGGFGSRSAARGSWGG